MSHQINYLCLKFIKKNLHYNFTVKPCLRKLKEESNFLFTRLFYLGSRTAKEMNISVSTLSAVDYSLKFARSPRPRIAFSCNIINVQVTLTVVFFLDNPGF